MFQEHLGFFFVHRRSNYYPGALWCVSGTSWAILLPKWGSSALSGVFLEHLGEAIFCAHAQYSGSFWIISGTCERKKLCTGVLLLLALDVFGTSWKVFLVHRRCALARFGVFLERLGKHFLCTGAVLLLTLGCLEGHCCAQAWGPGSLLDFSGTSWKDFFVHWCCTPAHFDCF